MLEQGDVVRLHVLVSKARDGPAVPVEAPVKRLIDVRPEVRPVTDHVEIRFVVGGQVDILHQLEMHVPIRRVVADHHELFGRLDEIGILRRAAASAVLRRGGRKRRARQDDEQAGQHPLVRQTTGTRGETHFIPPSRTAHAIVTRSTDSGFPPIRHAIAARMHIIANSPIRCPACYNAPMDTPDSDPDGRHLRRIQRGGDDLARRGRRGSQSHGAETSGPRRHAGSLRQGRAGRRGGPGRDQEAGRGRRDGKGVPHADQAGMAQHHRGPRRGQGTGAGLANSRPKSGFGRRWRAS